VAQDLNRAAAHCPVCFAEYREGFDTCADDGTRLKPGPAPVTEDHAPQEARGHRHPIEDRHDRPVALCSLPQLDADLLVGRLHAEGMVASADDPPLSTTYGRALANAQLARVWVLESQLRGAQEIARRALSGEDAV
jgi:hypothetical protein